ncbi:MAG: hypothetical protein ABRQ38_24470 [Candidatus Eremiobacterota bacterium]
MMDRPPLPSVPIAENTENSWCDHLVSAGCIKCGHAHLIAKEFLEQKCPCCYEGNLEHQPARLRKEPPEYIIPFSKTKEDIKPVIEHFTKGIWLKPDDFNHSKMMERLIPIYRPVWLVDSDVKGMWKGETGFDYQVKSSQESFDGGQWNTKEVIRTNIRWEPRAGEICRHYDNINLPASDDHKRLTDMAGDYDITCATSYSEYEKLDITIRIPDLTPESIWPDVKNSINNKASEECRVASSAQHIRAFAFKGNYESLNWTQLLLPLYSTCYKDDKGKYHPVYINGQTGAIGGIRLASQKKGWGWTGGLLITGIITFILGLLVFLGGSVFPPLAILGAFLILMSFIPSILSIFPVISTWRWNKKQKEKRFI